MARTTRLKTTARIGYSPYPHNQPLRPRGAKKAVSVNKAPDGCSAVWNCSQARPGTFIPARSRGSRSASTHAHPAHQPSVVLPLPWRPPPAVRCGPTTCRLRWSLVKSIQVDHTRPRTSKPPSPLPFLITLSLQPGPQLATGIPAARVVWQGRGIPAEGGSKMATAVLQATPRQQVSRGHGCAGFWGRADRGGDSGSEGGGT